MTLVWIAPGPPVQVEGFPGEAERSCTGALHLRGRSTTELTEDELAHIKKKEPAVWKRLRVLRQAEKVAKSKAKTPATVPKDPEKKEPAAKSDKKKTGPSS